MKFVALLLFGILVAAFLRLVVGLTGVSFYVTCILVGAVSGSVMAAIEDALEKR